MTFDLNLLNINWGKRQGKENPFATATYDVLEIKVNFKITKKEERNMWKP